MKNYLPDTGIRKLLTDIYGDVTKPTLEANDLFKIFSEISPDNIAGLSFLCLDCATEDEARFLKPNQQLAKVKLNCKIPSVFRRLPGKHNLCPQQIPEVLRLSERIFAVQNVILKSR